MIQAKELAAMKMKLADARAECGISQAALAKASGISKPVIVRAENGFAIERISAHAILKVLNSIRIDLNLEPVGFYELDWKIRGE